MNGVIEVWSRSGKNLEAITFVKDCRFKGDMCNHCHKKGHIRRTYLS